MNILFLNTTYLCGGAENITNQIFDGMRAKGHQVYEIVSYYKRAEKLKPGMQVLYSGTPMLLLNRLMTGNHSNASLSVPYSRQTILRFIREKHIDIVHLHNAHGNFLGIRDIRAIADICPIVWTVHDFWPLTGHCASPAGCGELWTSGCITCPHLENYPPLRKDISHRLLEEKAAAFSHPNIHFVAPSQWMLQQLRRSHLKDADARCIPNSLDINAWIPYEKEMLRRKYEIPEGKRILAFVAADPSKKTKGMHLLLEALEKLTDPEQYLLLIAGQTAGLESLTGSRFAVRHFGYLSEQKAMNEFYALADVLINPSLYETFGLVSIEAMASGTPVIAFSICAMEEIIPSHCGWCVEPENSLQLSETIQAAFASRSELKERRIRSRQRVETIYSDVHMLNAYEQLYQEIAKKP
jgi:glycosyltransferase involved in cell wall biosynthesis